ncbi:MAG: Gfo/Idh/MocA family oxidoreductase [Clostridia bacterium]|nr:Gfo/Idh/MocA family oxidoreductase [Clostridia bacterium]
MNIAIIGCSGHYGFAVEALSLRSGLTLAAVAPGSPAEDMSGLLAAAEKAGAHPAVYADWRAMLAREPLDIVAVNPWFCDTADVSIACLRRGLHVFSEKPLATTLPKLEELTAAWRDSGKALAGMFNLRYCAWFRTLRQAIDDGLIGEVRQLHGQKSYKLGRRSELYFHRETYGGIIPWVGIHALDWVLQLGGRCEWVSAVQDSHGNRGHGELEMSSALLARMENGVIGTVTADFLRPDGAPRHDDDRLRVTGTRGMLEALNGRVFLENEEPRRELPLIQGKNCFLAMLDAIGTPEAEQLALSALEVSRVALLARQAGDEKRAIACQ